MKKLLGIVSILLLWFVSGFLSYVTTIGVVYSLYGSKVLDSKTSTEHDNVIAAIMGTSFFIYSIYLMMSYLPFITIKFGFTGKLKLDGFERYELKYFEWKKRSAQECIDLIKQKIRERNQIG